MRENAFLAQRGPAMKTENLGRTKLYPVPKPEQIAAMRESLGLTQTQAGALVGVGPVTWARYESTADNARRPSIATWNLFLIQAAAGGAK